MAVVAVMKKDEDRRFILVSMEGTGADAVITMFAEGDGQPIKEIKRKTFTKGYKIIHGSLDDIKTEAPATPADTQGLIASVEYNKPAGRDIRLATVELASPDQGIDKIDEGVFIAEMVNNHGAMHGDQVMTDGGKLGYIALDGKEPRFDMLPPLKLPEAAEETVTFTYAGSGLTVTMTKSEFNKKHPQAITMKEPKAKDIDIESDSLPDFEENKPPLNWAVNTTPEAPPVEGSKLTTIISGREVEYTRNGECWEPAIGGDGRYPQLRIDGKNVYMHRATYADSHGDVGDDMVVRHKCDNTRCINPNHLEIGTQKDNVQDMMDRGRLVVSRGESNGSAKLTEGDVLAIMDRLAMGESHRSIARDFEIGKTTVGGISNGTAWSHITDMTEENSMRANRGSKLEYSRPFVPTPFFLRQSMISSYQQCPNKFYDTYENGYSEESIFTRVGTAIHGVMEDYYNGNTDVDGLFEQWWARHAIPEWDWYRDWKIMVAKYLDKQAGFEAPNVIATELEFQTVVNGVPVSGTIDRVDRVDERTIRLVDYKTNFKAFSEGELQESIQFMTYTSVIKTPELKAMLQERGDSGEFEVVICTYEMLRLGYRQTVIFEQSDLEVFQDWLANVWTMILSGYNRKPKLNQYCGYCQKRQRCDLYLEMLSAPVSSILTENTDIELIVEERERLSNNAKLIKNRLDEIESQIKAKLAENEGTMVIGEYEWSTKSGTRNSYPAKDVFRVLAMNGLGDVIPDLVSISKTSIDRVLKGNKEVLDLLDQQKVTTYTAPSLNKKKYKAPKA